MGRVWFPPDATEAPIVAPHVSHQQVKLKHEGSYAACVGLRSDNKSGLCVLASAAERLFPLWLQPGGERKPGSTVLT